MSKSTSKCEASDSSVVYDTADGGKAMSEGCCVDIGPDYKFGESVNVCQGVTWRKMGNSIIYENKKRLWKQKMKV